MTPNLDALQEVPSAVRPIVDAARRVVRGVAPRGTEEIACASHRPRSPSMMWKLVRYAVGGEIVVTVGTFTKHASIFFARGRELDDGRGLLEGSGKELRYITLRTAADAKRSEVSDVVKRAFALAEAAPRSSTPPARASRSKPLPQFHASPARARQ